MVSSQHDPAVDAAIAQPADAESAPPSALPAASDGSASSQHRPAVLNAPAASAMSGATAGQPVGSARIAARAAQSAAKEIAQAAAEAAQALGDAASVAPAGALSVEPTAVPPPAPPAAGDDTTAVPAPTQSLPEPVGAAPAGQPVAMGALSVPVTEAKGRTAIAEKVEKGMRQHFPGMTDETLAKWHSNLEERLMEAKAAHKTAKDGIKQVGTPSQSSSSSDHSVGRRMRGVWRLFTTALF